MTPLERAARVIMGHLGIDPEAFLAANGGYGDWIDVARAVISTIREPSEGMKKEGARNGGWSDWYDGPGETEKQATEVWQAMIDAALLEEEAPLRKASEPWQSADGRWWTPGDLTEDGQIVSAEPGLFVSGGVVWLPREKADLAESYGWTRGNNQGLPDKRDLVQVYRTL